MDIQVKIEGIIGEEVTRVTVAKQLLNWKEGDTITVLVNSPGGEVDESFAIIDLLNEYKAKAQMIAKNIGDVMSAAVGIFLVPDERYFNPTLGSFMIHNPWTETAGNARELIERAKILKDIEKRLIALYASRTNASAEILKSYMDSEIFMEAGDIEALGFAKITNEQLTAQKPAWKAVAFTKIDKKMEKEKLSSIEKLVKMLASKFKVKAIVLSDVNGKELDFGDITDLAEIVIGVTATVDGQPANGQFAIEQLGQVLTFENGVLIDVQPLQQQQDEGQQQAQEQQLEQLATIITEAYEENKKLRAEVTELRKEIAKIKAVYVGQKFNNNPASDTNEQKKIVKKFNI
jgi:ATP-dependent protease ClpP protease subunit